MRNLSELFKDIKLKDIKKKSLDKNMNVLNHVFINFIFTKLEFLCMAHLFTHWTKKCILNYVLPMSFCKERCVKTKWKETEHVIMSAARKHVQQQNFKIFCP